MANVKVSKELRDEVSKNQDSFSMGLNLQPTDTVLLLNGMYFDIDITDMSTILDSVTQELNIMEGLYSIGNCYFFVFKKNIYCNYLFFYRHYRQKSDFFYVGTRFW